MKKCFISAILFTIALALTGETVMVETVDFGPLGDLEQERQIGIVQMETGVMEALFDGGHLFFNMYTPNGDLDPFKSQNSLMQGKQTGARWFMRLRLEEGTVFYWFYSLVDFTLVTEGSIPRRDVDPGKEMTSEEYYFAAGKSAGESILGYMGG